jgi:hypothetical protein
VVYLMRADTHEPRGKAKGRRARVLADSEEIHEHYRNTTLTSLAGTMRRRGFGHRAIRAALLEENAERCTPPLEEAEVEGIAASVARYEPAAAPASLVRPASSRHALRTLAFTVTVTAEEVPADGA